MFHSRHFHSLSLYTFLLKLLNTTLWITVIYFIIIVRTVLFINIRWRQIEPVLSSNCKQISYFYFYHTEKGNTLYYFRFFLRNIKPEWVFIVFAITNKIAKNTRLRTEIKMIQSYYLWNGYFVLRRYHHTNQQYYQFLHYEDIHVT